MENEALLQLDMRNSRKLQDPTQATTQLDQLDGMGDTPASALPVLRYPAEFVIVAEIAGVVSFVSVKVIITTLQH
jgi:hypothetical protein